ncbi:MAG TPA: DNA mismatch repair protein MutS [Burkholderiaceae bacterium]|nr:DNA mismatch repair protein MutS [Burkholderiaceae bacterium]
MDRAPPMMQFTSILFPGSEHVLQTEPPACFHDLGLTRIVEAVTDTRKEYVLAPFFYTRLDDLGVITFRQEVMKDLDDATVRRAIRTFAQGMSSMRQQLGPAHKRYYKYEKARWFLGAAEAYCEAVTQLERDLQACSLQSRGMCALRIYLANYVRSEGFQTLVREVQEDTAELAAIRYCVRIKDASVTVLRFGDEVDYGAAVEATFEKFRRGAVKDYRAKLPKWGGMNHVEAQILDRVALLHPQTFGALEQFCLTHADFQDARIRTFDREIQFYTAYLEHADRFRAIGLSFCYPQISASDKTIVCRATYDLALADKLLREGSRVVTNDCDLHGAERVFVVTGPNQGGKTTFARTFGQLHYLAMLGCPVAGTEARLLQFDRLFTHFEREERIANLRGKLQDDLVRIHEILRQASPRSIVIINEIFASTTVKDALFLGAKIMEKIVARDLLAVVVTFLDELASFDENTVSMVSTVNPQNPAERTFKVMRKAADGLAYALAIAEKHHVNRQWMLSRIKP